MTVKAIAQQLVFDLTGGQEAVSSQDWVLCAMQKHGPMMIQMLWRILGNEEDVCDAYQDTFFRLSHIRSGARPDHVKAYLFRTASNTAISILRQKAQFKQAQERLTGLMDQDLRENACGRLEMEEIRERLRGQIAQLPDHLREVIVLRDLADLPYRQIGAMLGISQGTARVYRRRAIVQLSKTMAGFEP